MVIVAKLKNLVVAGDRLFILALTFVLVISYSGIVSAVGLKGPQKISSNGIISYTPHDNTTSWLHTDGKYIKDGQGNIVRLKGTATIGMQNVWGTPPRAIRWNTDAQTADLYNAIASSGANTVRVAINYRLMYDSFIGAGSYNYPDYASTLDSIVNFCQSKNLRVIWDFHADYWNGVWQEMSQSTWATYCDNLITSEAAIQEKITQITEIATRYRNTPTVIGIELINEPTGQGTGWDTYSSATRQAFVDKYSNYCGRLARAVHAVQPNLLVFVDAPCQGATTLVDLTYDRGDGKNRLIKAADGVSLETNIVYAYHYYNWHFGAGDSFVKSYAAGNYALGKTQMEAKYYERFWHLAEEYNVPIWYGEFGFWDTDVGGGANLEQLIRDIHQVHIDRGYSVNHWGCHTAMGESIVKQYTGTPNQIFNWKGLLWAEYMTR